MHILIKYQPTVIFRLNVTSFEYYHNIYCQSSIEVRQGVKTSRTIGITFSIIIYSSVTNGLSAPIIQNIKNCFCQVTSTSYRWKQVGCFNDSIQQSLQRGIINQHGFALRRERMGIVVHPLSAFSQAINFRRSAWINCCDPVIDPPNCPACSMAPRRLWASGCSTAITFLWVLKALANCF
jgi:hypothetical protein